MPWHSIHVYYYDHKHVDDLILDAVRPLFATLVGVVEATYVARHWRRGPHLRLNVRADPDRFRDVVVPMAETVVGGYLSARPSLVTLDPERLLPLHQRLAHLEREQGPLLPWCPDNTIHVEPYDRRLHVLGGELAADLLADFLAGTSDLSFQMTEHVRGGGGRRLRLAFDLMVAVAHALSESHLTRGFISYRSHAEAFLQWWPEGDGRRAAWDHLYQTHANELVERVRMVVAALDTGSTAAPFVSEWVRGLRPIQARGRRLIEAGELNLDYGQPDQGGAPSASSMTDVSPFHRVLMANDQFVRHVLPSAWFATFRLMLNYNYLHLTRLGVPPAARMLLCHLVANAVEDCYGCSALDLVSRPGQPVQPAATALREPA